MFALHKIKYKRSSVLASIVIIVLAITAFCALVLTIPSVFWEDQNWESIVGSMGTQSLVVVLVALVYLCSRFIKLYLMKGRPCATEDTCAVKKVKRNNRVTLWLGTLLLIIFLVFY